MQEDYKLTFKMDDITENLRTMLKNDFPGDRRGKHLPKINYMKSSQNAPNDLNFRQKFKIYQESLPANPFDPDTPYHEQE